MDTAERLHAVDEWLGWLHQELDRELGELVAVVATQPIALSVVGSTAAALAGRQHVAEQIDPLLQVIDSLISFRTRSAMRAPR